MAINPCPDTSDLRRLLRGELSEEEAAPLERHLLGCVRCGELATAFETDDREWNSGRGTVADPVAVVKLVKRLERLTLGNCWEDSRTLASGDSPGASSLPQVPGYEILCELGRGGMGVVYQARQLGLNRVVALKMILAGEHAGEGCLSRFRAEAEALGRLQHPHIIQVHEIGQAGARPFICLEFCAGGSLAGRLRQGCLP